MSLDLSYIGRSVASHRIRDKKVRQKTAILHQGFVPGYRVKFYELLNSIGENSYVIFHGSPPSNTGYGEHEGVFVFPNIRVRNYEFSFCGRKIIYQPVVKTILRGSYSAVVLGHEIKFGSNLVLFGLCKVIRKPVIWWGQGFEKAQDDGFMGRLLFPLVTRVKRWLGRFGDMYIVYTEGGAEKLIQSGVPKERIKIVRNTIDMEEQCALYAECIDMDPLEVRKKMGLRSDSSVLLYVGRLYKEKRVEELLHLIQRINCEKRCHSFVEAVIIGSGPELGKMVKIGSDIQGVHLVGELYDQRKIAEYMRISAALVIPGRIGLAVNHAFSQGLPVITRENEYHGPEAEYIVHGENGLIIEGDFENFVLETVEYLNSAECQKRMANGALKTGYTLGMEFMVKAFDEAVSRAINERTRKSGSGKAAAGAQ